MLGNKVLPRATASPFRCLRKVPPSDGHPGMGRRTRATLTGDVPSARRGCLCRSVLHPDLRKKLLRSGSRAPPCGPTWKRRFWNLAGPGSWMAGGGRREGGGVEGVGEREMDLRRKRHLGTGEEERRALELLDRHYSIWKALDGTGSPMR